MRTKPTTLEDIITEVKEVCRLGDLLLKPCTNLKNKKECGDQELPLDQMCPNCKKYWEEACKFTGDNVNDVLAAYYKEKA